TISATDEKNNPAAAVLWAAVVNTGVAPGARDRTLPTHFLLAGDVKGPDELEYADFLLTDHPKAREALDLVLGTQGWRRFAEQSQLPFATVRQLPGVNYTHYAQAGSTNPELTRLMVQNGQHAVLAEPSAVRDARKIAETYSPLYENAVQAVARAQTALDATEAKNRDLSAIRHLQDAESAARRAAAEQTARADSARAPVQRFRSAVWFGVAGFAALALLCGGVSLARPQTRLPLRVSTVGSFGLAAFLFVASGWGGEAQGTEQSSGTVPGARVMAKAAPKTEPSPLPRVAHGAENVDGVLGAEVAAAPAPEPKQDTKMALGGGGFGGVGAAPAPRLPLITPTEPRAPAPAAGMKFAPVPTGTGASAAAGPLAPPRALKSAFAPVAPRAPGEAEWVTVRPDRGAESDLARGGAMGAHTFGGAAKRLSGDDRVAALRKATADATRFAHERQRSLNEQLETQYAGRGVVKVVVPEYAGPMNLTDTQPTPAKIEALALQQIRGTVNPLPPLVVREYANPRPAPEPLPDAPEAPDTILWQPVLVVPANGKAVVTFALGNAPGGYRVVVAGHTADGRLGEARTVIAVAPAQTVVPVAPVPPGAPVVPAPQPRP
ncbi:MAG TPA: hypothetical protein VGE74_15185, partial [Gemmata sp.]